MTSANVGLLKLASNDCVNCPIRLQAICSRCGDDELRVLNSMKTYRTYPRGETLAYIGEPIRHVGTLVSGVASISQGLEDGRRQIMGILLSSDFLGRPGARFSQFDITAVDEVVMCRFEIRAFERLLAESPALGPRLLEMTMDELDAAREWMLLLGRKSARERIATLLHKLACKFRLLSKDGANGAFEFELPIPRETLADYLGMTIETVSRQITALRDDGVISTKGWRGIMVPDFERLFEETGDDNYDDLLP